MNLDKTVKLDEVVEINPPRTLKRGDNSTYVAMDDLGVWNRQITQWTERTYSGSGSRFKNGDTLLARITPCLENGKTAFVNFLKEKENEVAHGSTEFIVLSEKEGITDNLFIYYLARSSSFREYAIQHMDGTSGRQRVPASAIANFKFYLPSLNKQRTIAHILGTFDDKIELNRQMNETLEAMAQAIFKSWFVDPIQNGLPKGWCKNVVGKEFNITMGQSPPGETYNEIGEGIPFYQGRSDFGYRYPTCRVFCTYPTRFANRNDTLMSVRAPVGSINMAEEKCCIGRGVAAIRHNSGSRSYTYYFMHILEPKLAHFEAEGTVFGSINKVNFHNIECIAPSLEKVTEFEKLISPIDQMIENNEKESRNLNSIREALLLRLLAGEIKTGENHG